MATMTRRWFPLILLIIFALIAGWKLFNPQFYTTHDGGGHVIRMEEFHLALSEGQFPVRIAKRINYGLGYPFFHFNYPLIYYLADILYRLGFSFVGAFKTIMFISLIGGSGGVYVFVRLIKEGTYWTNKITIISGGALIASIMYMIVPFRFLNMYVRGALGEAVGLALLPWIFVGVERIIADKKSRLLWLIVPLALLIVSHNITGLMGTVLVGFYGVLRLVFVQKKVRVRILIRLVTAGIVSLLLTSWFWYPAFHDAPLTKLSELREDYRESFPTFSELLYSPWGFGSWKEGPYPGKMSPSVGVIHLAVFAVAVVYVLYRTYGAYKTHKINTDTALAWYFIGASALCVYFALELSEWVWDLVPVLQTVQLPWRFVGYLVFFISVLVGLPFSDIKNNKWLFSIGVIIVSLLLYTNRNHIRVNMYIDHVSPFETEEIYSQSTTSNDEHMPLYAPRIYDKAPNQNGDILPEDAGMSSRIIWKSNYHLFNVTTTQSAEFRDNTSYFPGWIGAVDGLPVAITYQKDEFKRLRVPIEAGVHTIEFWFIEPLYRKIVNGISLVTLMSILVIGRLKPRIVMRKIGPI